MDAGLFHMTGHPIGAQQQFDVEIGRLLGRIDPLDFEWSDVAVEVCDGSPRDVESGALSSDRFCPWGATVIAVDQAP